MTNEEKALTQANGWNEESLKGYGKAEAILCYLLKQKDGPSMADLVDKMSKNPFLELMPLYKRALREDLLTPYWDEQVASAMGEVSLDSAPTGNLNSYQEGVWLLAFMHEMSACERNVMSTPEAAAKLGITEQYVRKLIEKGDLKGQKAGRNWKVDRDSVIEYAKNH